MYLQIFEHEYPSILFQELYFPGMFVPLVCSSNTFFFYRLRKYHKSKQKEGGCKTQSSLGMTSFADYKQMSAQ